MFTRLSALLHARVTALSRPRPNAADQTVRLLGWFNFLGDFRLYGPIMVIYFAQVTGSYTAAASLLAVKTLSSAAFEVPTGLLSDRLGRRGTMIAGAVVMVAAHVGYACASGYGLLLAAVVLEGLATSLWSGNNESLLYDTLVEAGREEEFPRHSGRVNSMFQIALALAAPIGGVLAGAWSLRAVVAVSVVPQVLCVLVALRVREPRLHGPLESTALAHLGSALRGVRRDPVLRRMTLVSALRYSSESAAQLSPVFVAGLWPLWALGLWRTFGHGMAFISFRTSGWVINRLGPTRTLLSSELLDASVNTVALIKPTVFSPLLLGSPAYGMSTTAQQTLLQRAFTPHQRATMGSLTALLGSALYALVALTAGLIADHWGIVAALLTIQAVALIALPLTWRVHTSTPLRPEPAERPGSDADN
ncbi:MFS transporter [Actinokineospora globicatena]|uniref:MFS transporter n=1 Tax=Actinokineospora globicatena TaxID=103729 RepID=UPI0020A29452|nr:MFS transporter [Actinokineospora globicatena]MCP2305077.1 putative arabinose efflux permease, MFS family [Actinokineospora globicatena]GLW80542.1 MFS transporter [Actinokineospora globicatena]GLW87370.1 MFS transporter [Actinokineospora globicatena]